MSKYKLAIFDMDGTIADTDEVILHSLNVLYVKYKNGEQKTLKDIIRFSGPPIRETLKNEFPDVDLDSICKEFYDLSIQNYKKYLTTYPYCKEALINLKNNGVYLAIFTSKGSKAAQFCLELLHFENLFDGLIGADDLSKLKPDPEGIYKLMKFFNISNKDDVIYIGDNEVDVTAAKNAGVDCGFINWGPRAKLKNIDSKYKINSYNELGDLIL